MVDKTVDITAMSSDELIDHYIVLLMKQAEDIKDDEIDVQHATLLSVLHISRSLDQIEYRMFHLIKSLEGIRADLERKQ